MGVFAGKHGLITLRDLFKWAGRYAHTEGQDKFNDWEQTLAEDGEGRECIVGKRLFECMERGCRSAEQEGTRQLTMELRMSVTT